MYMLLEQTPGCTHFARTRAWQLVDLLILEQRMYSSVLRRMTATKAVE